MSLKVLTIYLWLAFLPVSAGIVSLNACEFAGSNITYIRTNTQKAIDSDKMNMVHYFTYKALSAIDKSKDQFRACGCEYAQQGIEESEQYLKKAIKASSILGARMLLEKSLEHTLGSLEALEDHPQIHTSEYGNNLTMNTGEDQPGVAKFRPISGKALEAKVDSSLENFRISLDKVISTLPCSEAEDYVLEVYQRCELELLKTNLTEGKRLYNLKTKNIAGRALETLNERCASKED
ncbi:hypothetical protein SAMN06265375_102318 [Muriicola jejuensis]|uniref:Uncharacterized protein n=1 Tax=Muriicola jejuensis TaxID=504488 RepID=A0A6P0UHU7_9FLAO|nr:hypothetical protein [Muriicola jejuensis]NER10703.1 hypothetical protein [Muriicola jejuensis]SMP16759.1 hypothetical protein SAMN06265375_102318 [Muriicola jejuensis]